MRGKEQLIFRYGIHFPLPAIHFSTSEKPGFIHFKEFLRYRQQPAP